MNAMYKTQKIKNTKKYKNLKTKGIIQNFSVHDTVYPHLTQTQLTQMGDGSLQG